MVKNKYFILPFLFLAWTIIFAHSIIPHHHHQENISQECNNCNEHEIYFLKYVEIHDCDTDCHHYSCHFHVEILVKGSIDNEFIPNADNLFLSYISFLETYETDYLIEFVSDQIPKTNYLRGPPLLS